MEKINHHKLIINDLNLITLKVKKCFVQNDKLDYISITGNFGADYPQSKFYNLWTSSNHKYSSCHSLLKLSFVFYDNNSKVNEDIISSTQKRFFYNNALLKRTRNIRMSCFYVYPNYIKFNEKSNTFIYSHLNDEYKDCIHVKDLLSQTEYNLFKGIGRYILKWILENITEFDDKDSNIILEASGGEKCEDMKKLTDYYKQIGFYPISEDIEYIILGCSEFHVVMMAKIHEIMDAIKNYR